MTLPTDVATTPSVTVTANFAVATTRVGVFHPATATWYLDKGLPGWQSSTIDGVYQNFGVPTDIPVAGDMNGDGFTEVGVYHPETGAWYFDLDNSGSWSGCLATGGTDLCLTQFGTPTDIPVTGDWNGDGIDEVGVYTQGGSWYFDMDGSGTWNPEKDAFKLNFGGPGHIPVTGDWNGDGVTEVGTYFQGTWYLDDGSGSWTPATDTVYQNFGAPGHIPVTGDWNDDGKTEVGTYYQGSWFLDNGNGRWDGDAVDQVIPNFGTPADKPVTGVWR